MQTEMVKEQNEDIKVTVGVLQDSVKAIGELINQPMRVSASFRLKGILNQIDAQLKVAEDVRLKLLKQYGTLDEEKQEYSLSPENQEPFIKEINELRTQEVVLTGKPIKAFDLGDTMISTASLMQLEWLISE